MPNFTVKQARLYRGYTQESMAEKLGVHRDTYRNFEAHPEKMPIDKALRFTEIVAMPIDSIFFRDDSTFSR